MLLKNLIKLAHYYEIKYELAKIAVPISSDYIEDIFSEPLRAIIPATTNLLVYHGTCTNKLKDIISHGGLDPSKSAEGKTWAESSPGIYVTTKITGFSSSAEFYAHKAAKTHGGDPIILEMSVPFGLIEMDPDDAKILEETQSMNEAGKVQGIVLETIPISKITKVYECGGLTSTGMNSYSFASYIEKLLKEKSTDKKYKKTLKEQLPLATRMEPKIDIEGEMADLLNSWNDNIFTPHAVGKNKLTAYDNALIIVFKYKNENAIKALKEYCEIMENEYSDVENYPSEYQPRPHESLLSFLKRYKKQN